MENENVVQLFAELEQDAGVAAAASDFEEAVESEESGCECPACRAEDLIDDLVALSAALDHGSDGCEDPECEGVDVDELVSHMIGSLGDGLALVAGAAAGIRALAAIQAAAAELVFHNEEHG